MALPRTSRAVTDELHELLTATDDQVILVGHSLGGPYARDYATRFARQVAGLVLLDVALKTAPTKALLECLPPVRRYQVLYRDLFDQELPALPSGVRARLIERHISFDWLAVGLREPQALERLYDEVRGAGPMPDVPVVVVASTGSDGFPDAVSSRESPELLQAEIDGKLRLYDRTAASSSRGEVCHVDAGHVTLPFRHPDVVVDAIHTWPADDPRIVAPTWIINQALTPYAVEERAGALLPRGRHEMPAFRSSSRDVR